MKPCRKDALDYVGEVYEVESLLKRHNTQIHIAMIVKRGKVIQMAVNSIGSRSRGCGYDNYSIHAERAVIKRLGNLRELDGAFMMVIRIAKGTKQVVNSEPCHTCKCHLEKCIKEYGLRRVYYS
jgi:deoxycytidylate deaminase